MKTSLNLSPVAAKFSRFRRSILPIPIVLATIFCATPSAAISFIPYWYPEPLPQPYALGANGAPIEYLIYKAPAIEHFPYLFTFWFSTPPDAPVHFVQWTATWGYVSGDPTPYIANASGIQLPNVESCARGRIYSADTQNVCSVSLEVATNGGKGGIGIDFITLTFDAFTLPPSSDPIQIVLPETIDVQINKAPATPEPNSLYLLGTGLLALVTVRQRKLRRS
jgi:hypothetical protein